MPRVRTLDAKLLLDIFAPNEKQEPVNVHHTGTMHHRQYGHFKLGMTQEPIPKLVLIHDGTQRVSIIHIHPLLTTSGEEMMKQ